jgi:hypothetical protein
MAVVIISSRREDLLSRKKRLPKEGGNFEKG